ncbi:MAG: hypothetical protein Q8M12_05330 [bacterium]|nr:hypothetical protein [bacterium]
MAGLLNTFRLAENPASSVKGRCAEILTRSVLAYGCAPRAASGFPLDRAGLPAT